MLPPREVLGLDNNCTLNDVKSAYYRYSREFHPDSGKNNFMTRHEKEELFKIYENAYRCLKNELMVQIVDLPLYNNVECENLDIPYDEKMEDTVVFHKTFEEKWKETHSDDPWSLCYEDVTPVYSLINIRPRSGHQQPLYELGINFCEDFGKLGKYSDLRYAYNVEKTTPLLERTMDELMLERDNVAMSHIDIENQKNDSILKIKRELYNRDIQRMRDIKTMKLTQK
jgi:hypothetical protein